MRKPYVVAINAVSGGGKTSLAALLHESLPDSSLFCFDDFDSTNVYPDDYHDWWARGGNLEEFDCPGMRAAVDVEMRNGSKRYVVMDYPLGRDHSRFWDIIDFSVWIESPLDVAMARRILRDFVRRCRQGGNLRTHCENDGRTSSTRQHGSRANDRDNGN